MRVLPIGLILLVGYGTLDALENARTPSEAFYMIKKKEGDKNVNPYDNDPHFSRFTVRSMAVTSAPPSRLAPDRRALPSQ